jgi:hypothetical protein
VRIYFHTTKQNELANIVSFCLRVILQERDALAAQQVGELCVEMMRRYSAEVRIILFK